MQKLRRNKDEAHSTARKLLDSKRQELEGGVSRRDVLSLLGSLPPSVSVRVIVEGLSPSQSEYLSARGLEIDR